MPTPKETDLEAALKAELAESGHPVLTNDEVAKAKADARAAVEKERKAAAIKQIVAEETSRLRREEGLVSGDAVKDEMVKVTIDLPEYSASIRVNGEDFYHGSTYTVPRHVANSFKEIMQRAWLHQEEIDGKTLAQNMLTRRDTKLTPVSLTNPPQAVAA